MNQKVKIPWQNRDRYGSIVAYGMTVVEAFMNPIDYFEALEIREDYWDPLVLVFINTCGLVGCLLLKVVNPLVALAVFFIMGLVLGLLFLLPWTIKFLAKLLRVDLDFKKIFYVLAYGSPAFLLALVPSVGYILAAGAFVVFTAIGLWIVQQVDLIKIIAPALLVITIPLLSQEIAQTALQYHHAHGQVDAQLRAQKVLAVLSVAAEQYALKNHGTYPVDSRRLVTDGYVKEDYCQQVWYGYRFDCELRNYGYYITARPVGGVTGRGKSSFVVTTGGKLRQAN